MPHDVLTHERIAKRAYELYQRRGEGAWGGNDFTDWLAAEREVLGSTPPREPEAEIKSVIDPYAVMAETGGLGADHTLASPTFRKRG